MKEKKEIKVLFHHGDFPQGSRVHEYFGPNGPIHRQLQKMSKKHFCWSFKGGFIHEGHQKFWKAVSKADVLFTRATNMDYNDLSMHWNHAEESMLQVLAKIKRLNPNIKIFFFEDSPENVEIFSKFGTFITDLHGDEEMLKYFRKL
jgi:hypothetical protein